MSKPFWERPFPQLYKCKSCGSLGIMREPEPWAGHLCNSSVLGEWEFVAAGFDEVKAYLDGVGVDILEDNVK